MAEKLTVERTVWIAAPRERVWQAVTTDSQMRDWWGDYWEIPSLQPGAALKFGDPSDLMTATIEVVDPPPAVAAHDRKVPRMRRGVVVDQHRARRDAGDVAGEVGRAVPERVRAVAEVGRGNGRRARGAQLAGAHPRPPPLAAYLHLGAGVLGQPHPRPVHQGLAEADAAADVGAAEGDSLGAAPPAPRG